MAADMEVHMMADMEVDKVADKKKKRKLRVLNLTRRRRVPNLKRRRREPFFALLAKLSIPNLVRELVTGDA